jgi:hypothetical protein
MSVLGTISRQDRGTAPVLPQLQTPPETTGFFQNIGAGYNQAIAGPHSTQNAKAIYESRHYDEIVRALAAEGEQATDMVDIGVKADSPLYHPQPGNQIGPNGNVLVPRNRSFANPFSKGPSLTQDVNPIGNFYLGGDAGEINQIWQAVNRVRQRKPDFLSGYKDQSALDALAQQQRQADQVRAGQVTARASTLGSVGGFIGGMAGSLVSGDPENFLGGIASAPAKSVSRQVLKTAVESAAVNAGAGVIAVPGQAADSARMGQPMTTGDVLHSVAQNAAVGFVLGSAHAVAPHVAGAVGDVAAKGLDVAAQHMPDAIRDPIVAASIRAGTVKDRTLLHEFQRAHSPYAVVDTSTPTEKAAAHVITQDIETQEQSPLHPEAAGANNDRLSAVAKALGVDLAPPDLPTSAPVQTATVRDHSADATSSRRPAGFQDALGSAEGTGKNPKSSADGYFQFTKGTWREYAPRVTDTTGMSDDQVLALRHNKDIASRAEQLYRSDNASFVRHHGEEDSPGNLSLAHFLGAPDAVKALKAERLNPDTPIQNVIDPRSYAANEKTVFAKHQTVGDVIAWAHKRIGAAVDHPPARPDAVPDEGYDYASPAPYTVESLRPHEVTLDPAVMQYKSGGDEAGVTDALKGVDQWNPLLSQQIMAWEPLEGGRVLVDGHQRVGLARRLTEQGQDIELPALVLREADGISAQDARTLGAMRNIANGTGSLIDNAKVLRDLPQAAKMLPPNGPLARDSMGLSRLSYEAFGAAVNEVVDPRIAAQVGLNAAHRPEAHMPIISLLAKEKIHDPREAAMITRQALADGFGSAHSEQLSMLGDEPQQSLYVPIARIMSAAAKRLRQEKRTFKTLTEKAGTIEGAGNVLDKAANESKVVSNDEALAILERTAHRAGPVRDALVAAARHELSGARRADAVDQFLEQLGGIDLRAAAGEGTTHGGDGGAPLEPGRDFPAEAADADVPSGSEPSLFDRAVAAKRAAEPFSDPNGEGAKKQIELLEHDLRPPKPQPESGPLESQGTSEPPPVVDEVHLFDLRSTGFRLDEEGGSVSIKDALDAADADEAAAQALRDCL